MTSFVLENSLPLLASRLRVVDRYLDRRLVLAVEPLDLERFRYDARQTRELSFEDDT